MWIGRGQKNSRRRPTVNLLGSIDFGRSVKTYLPGSVILVSLAGLVDCAFALLTGAPVLGPWSVENSVIAGVVAIPASVILGLLSNTLFFHFLHERLVERAVRAKHPDLDRAASEFRKAVIQDKVQSLPESYRSQVLERAVDVDALLLSDVSLPARAITKEEFWFYLEFQVNMALGVTVAWLAVVCTTLLKRADLGLDTLAWLILVLLLTAFLASAVCTLVGAARKNYYYYQKRLLSLHVAAVLRGLEKASEDQGN